MWVAENSMIAESAEKKERRIKNFRVGVFVGV